MSDYYQLVSDSMAPLIEVGDMVLIAKNRPNLKKNNLVLFKDHGKKVLHRIVKLDKNFIFLKGDNAYEIQKIMRKNVLGVGLKVFSASKSIELGSFKEKVFVLFDQIFFQRISLLEAFNYRVFRYNKMKRLKRWLW